MNGDMLLDEIIIDEHEYGYFVEVDDESFLSKAESAGLHRHRVAMPKVISEGTIMNVDLKMKTLLTCIHILSFVSIYLIVVNWWSM